MVPLLKHLVEITRHRDHATLNGAVIAALYELAQAEQVRALDILRIHHELVMKPLASITSGKITTTEDCPDAEPPEEKIAVWPALADCIEQRHAHAEQTLPDGRRLIWLPVWLDDKISACLEIQNPASCDGFTMELLQSILSIYCNHRSLLDYSERDLLTGLLNRKTFDENFSKLLRTMALTEHKAISQEDDRRQISGGKEQWLAVVDIDHFKRVNDAFGHLYGDEVLLLVANLLHTSFRPQDRLFRFGGEEFVIMLRATTLKDAQMIFERFRHNIEQYPFPQVGQITVSIGFDRIGSNGTPVVILGHADRALYFAKSNGRNQVCNYQVLVNSGDLKADMSNDQVEFF